MAYSITNLLNDISGVVHGTTTNKIPNVYNVINRAASSVLLDVDPKETQRILQLSQVFNSVYDYAAPPDLKGDRLIDVRPQAGRTPADIFTQGYETSFDANKGFSWDKKVYTQWNTGIKTLRIQAPELTAPVTLTDTSTITGWAATTGASTITLDSTNNVAGGGALVFNLLAGQSSGYVEISTLNPVDYTSYLNQSYGFLWVYLPSGAAMTSVDVRWGTSSSAYYNYTATATQQGTAFQNGWNLLAFPWSLATVTGSPTITSIKYVRVTFNYNSALQTGVKICNLTFNLGYIFEAVYYSKYMFRDPSTNAFQERVVDSTDNGKLINLDTEAWPLMFNKTAFFVAQSLQGADAEYDAQYWDTEYQKSLKRYIGLNPAEAMIKAEVYYKPGNKSYNKLGSGIWPH
jgi:hypothetical protein